MQRANTVPEFLDHPEPGELQAMPSRSGAASRGGRDGGAARLDVVQRRTRGWAADPEVRRWLAGQWDRYMSLCWDWCRRYQEGSAERESHPGTLGWRGLAALPLQDRLAIASQVVIGVHDAGAIDPIVPPKTREQWGSYQQGNVDWGVRTEGMMRELAMPLRGCRAESDGSLDPRKLRPEFAEQCLELVQREYRAQSGGPVEGGTSAAPPRADAMGLLLGRHRAALEEIRTEWKRADEVMAEFEARGMGRETGAYEKISAGEHGAAWSMSARAFDRIVLKLLPLVGDSLRIELLGLWDALDEMSRDCRAAWTTELDRRVSRLGLLLDARSDELRGMEAPAAAAGGGATALARVVPANPLRVEREEILPAQGVGPRAPETRTCQDAVLEFIGSAAGVLPVHVEGAAAELKGEARRPELPSGSESRRRVQHLVVIELPRLLSEAMVLAGNDGLRHTLDLRLQRVLDIARELADALDGVTPERTVNLEKRALKPGPWIAIHERLQAAVQQVWPLLDLSVLTARGTVAQSRAAAALDPEALVERVAAALATRARADSPASADPQVPERDTPKQIFLRVAVDKYHVSDTTIRDAVRKGELKDLRPRSAAKNSPLILDENEIAARWPLRGT